MIKGYVCVCEHLSPEVHWYGFIAQISSPNLLLLWMLLCRTRNYMYAYGSSVTNTCDFLINLHVRSRLAWHFLSVPSGDEMGEYEIDGS